MISPVAQALDIVADLDKAKSSREVGRLLLDALMPFGARTIYAASFPLRPGISVKDYIAGRELLAQITPHAWVSGYQPRNLHLNNPVIFAPMRRASSFRWSEPGYDDLKNWAGLEFARDLGIEDGITVPCHGPDGRVGVVSFGFERIALSPGELLAITMASLVAHERMRTLSSRLSRRQEPLLSTRERDCLAFVADGRSDGEIAELLGISHHTAHAHIENAKRKLGARTRAQAVALLLTNGLF
ncbi:MAG: autoinducer binding domain-containing protein [Aquamicrobium sp.]|nr:autoinducer binding domain-containing protein [Aquamicrobium sp.]